MKKYNEFINERFFKKRVTPESIIDEPIDTITEEDDTSTDFVYLLKKVYDNNELYLTNIYRDYGAVFQIPYSDGKKREIRIRWDSDEIIVSDGPRNLFQGRTDDDKYKEIVIFYVEKLKNTEFDLSN